MNFSGINNIFDPANVPYTLYSLSVFKDCHDEQEILSEEDNSFLGQDIQEQRKYCKENSNETTKSKQYPDMTKDNEKQDKMKPQSINKSTVRSLRKFFKDLFKKNNQNLIRKRYSNCTVSQLYAGVKKSLALVIPSDSENEDLIYFTMGIIDLKKVSRLPCKPVIKNEIDNFLKTTRVYSRKKLSRALESESFRTLCRCFINNRDIDQSSYLIKALRELQG
ncbi:unnamed protein product [Moneuplotes crassus]|uniref:Uncharacterized protein n=1 Tax=Euplotes crassus TaxID=5936 RepID=A0AAD1Y2Q6_EUPCR|nr:unnamed protein product [Moneuplotes crassus]